MNVAAWPLNNRLELIWVINMFLFRITENERGAIHTNCKSADQWDNAESGRLLLRLLTENAEEFIEVAHEGVFDGIHFDNQDQRAFEYCRYFATNLQWDAAWVNAKYKIPLPKMPDDKTGKTEAIVAHFTAACV